MTKEFIYCALHFFFVLEPKFYTIEQHLIPPEALDRHVHFVVKKLRQNGFVAYVVGGWVRDSLMGTIPKDFDISTSATPEEIKKLFSNCILIGNRFRLAHIRFGKKVLEVATFRTGDVTNSSLIIQDNDYGTEKEDVLRRDFTINGLLYNPESAILSDYVEGYPDAKKKILRTIGDPKVRFSQDPVRMLRLLKFQARFDLSVEKKTLQALKECKKSITKSSQARIFEEILRMLESGFAAPFIKNLAKYGFISLLLPTLTEKLHPYIFQFLTIIDQKQKQYLTRPLLLTCLCYPLFVHNLKDLAENHPPNLQEIALIAGKTIDQVFLPFFQVPRKMKSAMSHILTTQCRFTPLQDKPNRKTRIPSHDTLSCSVQFLKIRAELQPELMPTYENMYRLCKKILAEKPLKKKVRRRGKKR